MKNLFKMTALTVGFASQALAGSPAPAPAPAAVNIAPPAAAAADWSGFYAGGLVSFDGGDISGFSNNVQASNFQLDATTAFGGFAGYNKQVNSLVFGAELAYTTGDISVTGLANSFMTDRIDLKARAGYSLGRAMVYGVVGYSMADTSDVGTIYPAAGLNYGVGVDYMVTDHIFVGAEYLMRDLTGENVGINRIDSNVDSASIRAGFKF